MPSIHSLLDDFYQYIVIFPRAGFATDSFEQHKLNTLLHTEMLHTQWLFCVHFIRVATSSTPTKWQGLRVTITPRGIRLRPSEHRVSTKTIQIFGQLKKAIFPSSQRPRTTSRRGATFFAMNYFGVEINARAEVRTNLPAVNFPHKSLTFIYLLVYLFLQDHFRSNSCFHW